MTINYDPTSTERLSSGNYDGVEVVDWPNQAGAVTGFAANHNLLFQVSSPEDYFIIINPDCIPQPDSLDILAARKERSFETIGIVEGRQWPFEHPKEYDGQTGETPWASGAFALFDARFYQKVGGMDEIYFMYVEDVDISWQAWLNNYAVIYEPKAVTYHFSGGQFYRPDLPGYERFFSLRNFLIISRKFFGPKGEAKALKIIKKTGDRALIKHIIDEYRLKVGDGRRFGQALKRHHWIKITGLNLYHRLRDI